MSIYQPAEDSYLLQETLKKYLKDKPKSISILDMGSGSGIQAQTCKELGFNNVIVSDINQKAVTYLSKQGFTAILSNLFNNIPKKQKFNLIIFNPPYLPFDKREPEDSKLQTTAGKKGYEIIIKFLKQAKFHLSPEGVIILLFSSLSQPEVILKAAKKLNYKYQLLNKKSLQFFEELFVYKFFDKNDNISITLHLQNLAKSSTSLMF